MRDHPDIRKTEMDGHTKEPEIVGQDSRHNDIYKGDTVYELNDKRFVELDLSYGEIEILEIAMADKYTI